LDTQLESYVKEWRKRKAIVRAMVDQMADFESKKPAEVWEERGLDLDTVDIATIGKL